MTWPVPRDGIPSAVSIGKFDGVHLGHRAVIDTLRERANGDRVVVVTFDKNPLSVVDPSRVPDQVVSTRQKVEALTALGVDLVVVIPFTDEFRELSADEFVREVLVEGLNARTVMVGRDFRYGKGGSGTVETLLAEAEHSGFDVVVVGDVFVDDGSERVSSSLVRDALRAGNVERAAQLLGRPHSVRGEVVRGHQRGRELGYPTANLEEHSEGFVPASGVYAGTLEVGGETYFAGISVGNNPTFSDVLRLQVEAHALDADFDAYGLTGTITFTHRLRDTLKFDGVDSLIAAMDEDVREIRQLIASGAITLP
jgi:riboflavin kinase/FMN adenylyltransferase